MYSDLRTPVTFIFFNRLDTTKCVFEEIRKVRPAKLYLVADAPRRGRDDDIEKVKETREYVESRIDWPCEVNRNYAESNMGCKLRISSGLSWVLSIEEETIVLEDDVVPRKEFFFFCQQMLNKYRNVDKIMMISGTNLIRNCKKKESYYFSYFSSIWGWATWRRAWEKYDPEMKDWPNVRKHWKLWSIQPGLSYLFLVWNMNYVYRKEMDTWDFIWDYARYRNRGLGVVPNANLIKNIGFNREDAVHTKGSVNEDFSYGEIVLPIKEDREISRDKEYDSKYIKKNYPASKAFCILIKKVVHKVIRTKRK